MDPHKLNPAEPDETQTIGYLEDSVSISGWQRMIGEWAKEKGWRDEPVPDFQALALMTSEIGEAVEAVRDGNPPSEKADGFDSLSEELADLVIRALDHSDRRGVNLEEVIAAKMRYNRSRPYRHGRRC